MGTSTSVLKCQNKYEWLGPINCTLDSVPFGQFGSNANITGIGTDISFVLTTGLSLVTCFIVQIWCDRLRHHEYRKLLEPLVVSFGDQQLLRGLSLSIATLFSSSACTIDGYRYNVLAYLLIMAIVSHMSSVLVLRSYVNGQILLSSVRFVLVLAQVVFAGYIFSSRVSDTFPSGIPNPDNLHNTTMVLPAVCFEHPGAKPYSGLADIPHSHNKDSAAFAMYIMLCVFYSINFIITGAHVITYYKFPQWTWQIQVKKSEESAPKFSWFWWMGVCRGLILLGAVVMYIWATIKMYQLKKWMTDSGWLTGKNLQDETQWTFGQLLSALLLAAAPMAVLGAWSDFKLEREEIKRRREHPESSSMEPLRSPSSRIDDNGRDTDRYPFSPSTSSFGSQAGLMGNAARPGYTSQPEYDARRTSIYSGHSIFTTAPPSYMDDIEMYQPSPPARVSVVPPGPNYASVPSYRGD